MFCEDSGRLAKNCAIVSQNFFMGESSFMHLSNNSTIALMAAAVFLGAAASPPTLAPSPESNLPNSPCDRMAAKKKFWHSS